MKTVLFLVMTFFTLGSAVYAQTKTTVPKKEVQTTIYSCPMHPKEISDKKGKCSKCGMDLVATKETLQNISPKGSPTTKVAKNKYVCTMDGATSDKPGKCPKCGMALTEKKIDKNK